MVNIRYNQFVKSNEKIREDWYRFANAAFVEWRGPTRRTVTEFAEEWLGLPQPVVSRQLSKNGTIPRDQKSISAWVSRYGNKVYEVLGWPVPQDDVDTLPEPLRSISKEVRETLAEYKVSGDSPEGIKLLDDIMKKHGYKSN